MIPKLQDDGRCPFCRGRPRRSTRKGYGLCGCDRAYDQATGNQIENFAWVLVDGRFVNRLSVPDHSEIALTAVGARE